jgi:hypothetical protein
MQTELVVISAIIGTLIIGRGIWQYVSPKSSKTRRNSISSNSTRSSRNSEIERAERVEKYKAAQRALNRVDPRNLGPREQYDFIRRR